MASPDDKTRRRSAGSFWVPAALVAVGLSLSLVAIFFLGSDVRRELDAMAGANRDSTQWTVSQTEVELARFRATLLTETAAEAPDLARVRRSFDVLYSRFVILMAGEQFRPLRALPEMEPLVAQVRDYLDRGVAVIDADDAVLRANLARLLGDTEAMSNPLRRFILKSLEVFADESDRRRELVHQTLGWMAWLTAAIVLTMFVMILVLVGMFRRARLMARDREEDRIRLEAIISTSMDAVLVAGEDGRILEFNGAAERIFGRSVGDVIGRDMADVIVPDHLREAHRKGMDRYRKSGVPHLIGKGLIQIEALRGDGTTFPVEMSLAEAETADGRVFVSFLRDITHRLAAQEELIVARDRAMAGEQAKASLVAVMSHEMRTPLNGILGTLDLLMHTSLDPRQRDYADVIRQSGSLLKRHIDDVLDLSRLDASKMTFARDVFSLNRLLQDVADAQSGVAARRGNSVRVATLPPAEAFAKGDQVRVQQVLLNLVGNAVKFTRDGRIDVDCDRLDGGDMVEFRVADNGIGIPEDQHARIFDDFVTIDVSYGRTAGGTGLGLAITRRLVEAMGGEIGVESEPGVGSVFWVRLPLPKAPQQIDAGDAAALPAPDPQAAPARQAGSFHVLLVEDNPINRMVAREMLVAEGAEVSEATNGREAVEMASERTFDLILTDIGMPEMDGIEATGLIRAPGGRNSATPVVALTAHAFPADIARFEAAGIRMTLTKPTTRGDIRRMLDAVLGGEASSAQDAPAEAAVDPEALASMAEVLGPDKLGQMLARFEDQAEALLRDWSAGSPADLADQAHKLAGSAAVFGARALHARLAALETDLRAGALHPAGGDVDALATLWRETRAALRALAGTGAG